MKSSFCILSTLLIAVFVFAVGSCEVVMEETDTVMDMITTPPPTVTPPVTPPPTVPTPPAVEGTVVYITPAEVTSPAPGQELTFTVDIAGATGEVGTFDILVSFDPTALRYVSGEILDYLSDTFSRPFTVTENSVTFEVTSFSGTPTPESGSLVEITFQVLAVKSSTIELERVRLVRNADAAVLDRTTVNAEITAP